MATKRFLFFALLAAMLFTQQGLSQAALTDSTFQLYNSTTQTYSIDTIKFDKAATNAIDFESAGQVKLASGENYNLALGKDAYVVYAGKEYSVPGNRIGKNVIDGSFTSYLAFPASTYGGQAGSYLMIDLQAVRNVNTVNIYCMDIKGTQEYRLRTYSIYTGLDTLYMERAFFENDNMNQATPLNVAKFEDRLARFIAIRVDAVTTSNIVLSEIQVYGTGYLPEGYLYTKVRPIGRDVNFGKMKFDCVTPPSTGLSFAVRTGPTPTVDSTWSSWSSEITTSGSLFDVSEPRKYLQYRAKLTTDTLNTPIIRKVSIEYDTILVVTTASGSISPKTATTLQEQEFTLSAKINIKSTDAGVDSIYFITPSPVKLQQVLFNDTVLNYSAYSTFKDVAIALSKTIKTNGEIKIVFRTTPFIDKKPHTIWLISRKYSGNPQRVDSDKKDNIEAWSIILEGVPGKLINSARLNPNPFTPNGDGMNDETVIEFYLGKLGEGGQYVANESRDLKVTVYDLRGRKIREIFKGSVTATAFAGDNRLVWNGRDDDSQIVRPGVYIVKIDISSDNGTEQIAKTVVVSY